MRRACSRAAINITKESGIPGETPISNFLNTLDKTGGTRLSLLQAHTTLQSQHHPQKPFAKRSSPQHTLIQAANNTIGPRKTSAKNGKGLSKKTYRAHHFFLFGFPCTSLSFFIQGVR